MKFFKFILVILYLATSSVWAETISSTIIGGNWSDIETWEDGNVPTELDDVVINGVISIDSNTVISGIEISRGGTLQKTDGFHTLTVNGDLTNKGNVKDDSNDTDFTIKVSGNINNDLGIFNGEKLFLEVAGDVINKGIWSNNSLRLTSGADSRTISGNTISSNVFFEADFEVINTNFTFSGNVDFSNHIIT
ncbi:MAG: hypothetical protein KAG43_03060, partial [Candidatus Marithrix sp.]|nr:hypothetical protein [Candidatus Marithrix sp.]